MICVMMQPGMPKRPCFQNQKPVERFRGTIGKILETSGNMWSCGDFSHGPQHVFWTCSYQMDKSRDMSLKKNTDFLDGLK